MSYAPLIVTQGDPSGIGPEVTLKAWRARKSQTQPFFVLGDAALFERQAADLKLDVPIARVSPQEAANIPNARAKVANFTNFIMFVFKS